MGKQLFGLGKWMRGEKLKTKPSITVEEFNKVLEQIFKNTKPVPK